MKQLLIVTLIVTALIAYASDNKDGAPAKSEQQGKEEKKDNFKNFLKLLFGDDDDSDDEKESSMPKIAMEYVKMCEPELGVPPKINLDDCIEIPLYVN
tara:strand:+ start:204 stop:497 length:294 start_codon:yes stop_codon:yes gene_type:complete